MSLLFKHLRVHQVFGANTDVGKTILTSALVRASAAAGKSVFYLKPVSTGDANSADVEHIKQYRGSFKDRIQADCLYQYQEPVSPHLAARLANSNDETRIPTDQTVVNSIAHHIRQCAAASSDPSHMYVETAGGVHSPTLSGTTQLDCYRPLFLPTILVGDSKLGGISSTISAYESLVLRGFLVDAILLFRDEYYRNWEYLRPYFADRGVHVSTVNAPPPLLLDTTQNHASTEEYYQSLLTEGNDNGILSSIEHLDACHKNRLEELESMPRRTLDSIWWPFVQHSHYQTEQDVNVIDSAYSDFFTVVRPSSSTSSSVLQPQFDGSASWWTQAFGHTQPALTLAAARASGRYGHVMFPRATHLPALQLAERLVKEGPGKGWASKAYFSDDGSTGMEIALKMALRAFTAREGKEFDDMQKKSLGILGLKGSYHGDTIGVMNACEEGVYTCEWHHAKGYWLEPPTVSMRQGKVVISVPSAFASEASDVQGDSLAWVYDVPARLDTPLAHVYREHIEKTLDTLTRKGQTLGALVLEPLVMGAGGMLFVDPLFQRVLVDVVRGPLSSSSSWSGLPVIFDEVFVGLYRIGMESTTSVLGIKPDISVYAKILTGGLLPLAVTLASNSIYEAFLSDKKADALLHGHSYTAHAMGCEVANESLRMIDGLSKSNAWKEARAQWKSEGDSVWSFWDPVFIETISRMDNVAEVMTLGTVLAIKIRDDDAGYTSHSAETVFRPIDQYDEGGIEFSVAPGGAPFGVHFRTLGNVAYFMTSLNTSSPVLRSLEDRIWKTLQRHS
ncbi:onanonoxo-7-onima-8-eninoihtemlysoneda [Armillaria novae-zelandiae]|uniref:Onanonoxo-7-onima-8-eninoihtemlysoneda n=1 Tax=Armillaria novae-zelandiae TaxID=153914 RepID=A0AA39PAE6_9AGAR|nr:onanonoxo-7-onima-8-eninoihtemlysoneda [Armillaria novae-zelandiae]